MPDVFIQPRGDRPGSNHVIQLAVELGEFRVTSGCAFDVTWAINHTLKVTYWQDETFTALRLKFGHMFVSDPAERPKQAAPKHVAQKPLPKPAPRPSVRPLTAGQQPDQWVDDPDWKKMIWKLSESDDEMSTIERLKQEAGLRRLTARYA